MGDQQVYGSFEFSELKMDEFLAQAMELLKLRKKPQPLGQGFIYCLIPFTYTKYTRIVMTFASTDTYITIPSNTCLSTLNQIIN